MRIANRKLCLALIAYLVLIAVIALLFMQEAKAQDSFGVMSVEDKADRSPSTPANPTKTEEKSSSDTEAASAGNDAATAENNSLEDQKIGSIADANENKPLETSGVTDSSFGSDAMTVFIYLGVIVVLIVVSLMVFKKFMPGGNRLFQSKVIEILGRTFIAPKQGLFLVKLADRILLVGSTGTSINTLCEITDPDEMLMIKELAGSGAGGVSEGLSSAFRSLLGRKRGEFDDTGQVTIASGKAKGEMGKIKTMISDWKERHSD